MAFKEIDLQRNNLTKKLGALLPQIDPKVCWVDYIPKDALKTGESLVAIGMKEGSVKYVNVTNKSPFKMINEVLNAMDDYHLEVQFLNARQMSIIADDIAILAKDRMKIANDTLAMLEENYFSEEDCLEIIIKAQNAGIFPDFFPETENQVKVTSEMLERFLKTNQATFIDTQIISDLITEQLQLHKENLEMEYDEEICK